MANTMMHSLSITFRMILVPSRLKLPLLLRRRDVKFNAISGIDLLCCGSVKIGKLVFTRVLLAEDPQRLAGDSVAFGRDAVAIAKNKNCGYGGFFGG